MLVRVEFNFVPSAEPLPYFDGRHVSVFSVFSHSIPHLLRRDIR